MSTVEQTETKSEMPQDASVDASSQVIDPPDPAAVSMLHPGEAIEWSLCSDMQLNGAYGQTWLGATDRRIFRVSNRDSGDPDVRWLAFDDIRHIDFEDLFGSARVRVRTDGVGETFAVCSKTLVSKFRDLCDDVRLKVETAHDTAGLTDLDRSDNAPADANADIPQANRSGGGHGNGGRGHGRERTRGPQFQSPRGEQSRRCPTCGQVIPRRVNVCPACLDKRKLLTRFLGYTLPYWKITAVSLAILMTATFIGLTPPLIMRALIDDVLTPATTTAVIPADVEPGALTGGDVTPPTAAANPAGVAKVPGIFGLTAVQSLGLLVGLLLGVNVLRNLMGAVRGYLMAKLGQSITYDLRTQVYQHLHRLSLNFYNDRQTGQIMASITQDVNRLQGFLANGLQNVIRNVLTIVMIVGILFYLNASLAIIVLLPTPLIVWATIRFGRRMRYAYMPLWRRWARLSALLSDVIPGVRVVKAFAQEDREVERFQHTSKQLYEGELQAAKVQSVFAPVMTFITSIGTLIIWWVGGNKVLGLELSLGAFVAFTGYMWQFYGPVESLCNLNQEFQRAATSAERVFEVLDAQADVTDDRNAQPIATIEGRVEFDHVTFSYDQGQSVLRDLSFTIEPGEMIGLAGHSGAGKSTLINLICRFYDASEGVVRIDGRDVRDVTLGSLRSQIGVVLQDPFLFTGTVAENIAYGKPDATCDQIIAAARAANAHGFIMDMPFGYDSMLGERGVRLSGGERQRISIARAVLRDPRILILDEATASLDTVTEHHIQEAMERLIKGRTTFAIAHRLSTLRNANRLLIIDHGALAEIGTHDELIELDGVYAKLVKMQTEMSRLRAV